ncbi:MAG TPA: hypothetical protein VHT26_05660 [Trebonia sp.]|nr:hypothetical protein [Trebonia sp.]
MASRIPKAELTGLYGAVVKRVARKMVGAVPEPLEVTSAACGLKSLAGASAA